jgi:tRNA(Ile)-lysidine synthetase-like protein
MRRLTQPGANPPSATRPSSSQGPIERLARAVAAGADRLKIPDGAAILLAVSGGPDSTALLHGTVQAAPARRWRLTAAHLDHGLREESADEAHIVAAACTALGIKCELRRVDVRAVARQEHRSVEDAGRQARYRFLEEVAAPSEALIATAHTADDAAETVLLRLVRGTGLHGLRGIPERRGRIVRPLLRERRATLRAALDEGGIGYLDDPSNAGGWRPMTTTCSTRWPPPSWRAAAVRAASTGPTRRIGRWVAGSCGWRSATRRPPPSAWRRCSTRPRDRGAA